MDEKQPILTNRLYDMLKFVAQILLPSVGALYFALAGIWELPKAEEVVGTIVAIDAFLGAILGLSSKAYNDSDAKYDGKIEIFQDPEEDKKLYSLTLDSPPDELDAKKQVVFKVDPK